MERVMVGMSGGVDSSVAALLLAQQGNAVTGVTLRLHGDLPDGEIAQLLRLSYDMTLPRRQPRPPFG